MAVYQWVTKTDKNNLLDAIAKKIEETHFRIEKIGTTEMQVSALYTPKETMRYWSGVRMLASWMNFSAGTIKIEVRSDEPMLRPDTHCERSAKELIKVFPSVY